MLDLAPVCSISFHHSGLLSESLASFAGAVAGRSHFGSALKSLSFSFMKPKAFVCTVSFLY